MTSSARPHCGLLELAPPLSAVAGLHRASPSASLDKMTIKLTTVRGSLIYASIFYSSVKHLTAGLVTTEPASVNICLNIFNTTVCLFMDTIVGIRR